jgi:hypothetical protein
VKWFRHEADARRNKKIQWVCDQLGTDAGYARVFKLYEIFSGEWQNKNSAVPSLKIGNGPGNTQFFSKELGISEEEVIKTLKILAKAGIIDATAWKQQVVCIPKLTEYSNEWFKTGKQGEALGRPSVGPNPIQTNNTVQYKTLQKAQYPETKISELWEEITGRPVEDRKLFRKELRELIRLNSEETVLANFEIWAEINQNQGYKKPITSFLKQYQGVAMVPSESLKGNGINDLAVDLSYESGGIITFGRRDLTGLAQLLSEFSRDEVISAFRKFCSENELSAEWGAKNFVEKAGQIILVSRKQKLELDRQNTEIERLKAQVQAEESSRMAASAVSSLVDEELLKDAMETFGIEENPSETDSERFLEAESGN